MKLKSQRGTNFLSLVSEVAMINISLDLPEHMRHDLRTGFQRKLFCKPLTGLQPSGGLGAVASRSIQYVVLGPRVKVINLNI